MPKQLIIGLVGEPGSGKDTIAKMLAEHNFARVSFADPIRAMLWDLNPEIPTSRWDGDRRTVQDLVNSYGWDAAKRMYPAIRQWLKDLGMAARTHISKHVWARVGCDDAYVQLHSGMNAVITDLRFPEELGGLNSLARITGHTFHRWHIKRDSVTETSDHASDSHYESLGPFARVIDNNYTTDFLQEQVREALSYCQGLTY